MNPKRPWLKLYTGMAIDPDIHALTPLEFKIWIFTLIAASEADRGGLIPDAINTIAHTARTRRDAVENAIGSLRDREMISGSSRDIRVKGWAKYQAVFPLASEEVRQASTRDNGSLDKIRGERDEKEHIDMPEIQSSNDTSIAQNTLSQVFDLWQRINGKKPSEATMQQLDDFGQLADTFRLSLNDASPWRQKDGVTWLFTALERGRDGTKTGNISINYVKAILRSMCAETQVLDTIKQSNGKDRDIVGWDRFDGHLLYADD